MTYRAQYLANLRKRKARGAYTISPELTNYRFADDELRAALQCLRPSETLRETMPKNMTETVGTDE